MQVGIATIARRQRKVASSETTVTAEVVLMNLAHRGTKEDVGRSDVVGHLEWDELRAALDTVLRRAPRGRNPNLSTPPAVCEIHNRWRRDTAYGLARPKIVVRLALITARASGVLVVAYKNTG